MNISYSWKQQTQELIDQLDKEIGEYFAKADELIKKRTALEEALLVWGNEVDATDLRGKTTVTLNEDDVRDKTQRDIMKLIASRNNGVLVVKDAKKRMIELGVFGNPDHAYSALYSIILRRTNEFIKIADGIYRVPEGKEQQDDNNNLRIQIQEMKQNYPNLTKDDIVRKLQTQGYDFKGKSPKRVVHGVWMSLGYNKVIQPSLMKDG